MNTTRRKHILHWKQTTIQSWLSESWCDVFPAWYDVRFVVKMDDELMICWHGSQWCVCRRGHCSSYGHPVPNSHDFLCYWLNTHKKNWLELLRWRPCPICTTIYRIWRVLFFVSDPAYQNKATVAQRCVLEAPRNGILRIICCSYWFRMVWKWTVQSRNILKGWHGYCTVVHFKY